MSVRTPHIILIGNIPALNLEGEHYLIHTIEESTTKQDINRFIDKMNPLLVIKVISNRSVEEAMEDLEEALAITSSPVIGLHISQPDGFNLVLTESCNINKLDNLIVCSSATHDVTEIVQWAIKLLIPQLAAERLSVLSGKQSLKERLLHKPDSRPELERLARSSQFNLDYRASRTVEVASMDTRIWVQILSSTANRINIAAKIGDARLDVGTTGQLINGTTQLDTFILGRIGTNYTLAQTVPPILIRRGLRMPYTTKVTITIGDIEHPVLGYDLSSSGISIHQPDNLDLETGMEVLVTTELQAELKKFDLNVELNQQPGEIIRFFQQDGKRLVAIKFRVPKFELLDIAKQVERYSDQFRHLMDHKQREYARWLKEQGNKTYEL